VKKFAENRKVLPQGRCSNSRGFTLIELIIVVTLVGVTLGLLSSRLGTLDPWKERSALRRISELVVFLNNQAVMDQAFYRLEFDFESNSYRVGVMRPDDSLLANPYAQNLSALENELAAMLSPSLDGESTMIPPPSFPSLAKPTLLPGKLRFMDVVTPRGTARAEDRREERPFLLFSPRGTSEFGVIHLTMSDGRQSTILVNPWTGLAEVYNAYKEFQWTLGNRSQS
jgi:prepilin-type N-terminal cleavage/methylation domain-containing protein